MELENKAQKTKREALEALPRIVQAMSEAPFYTFCSTKISEWLVKNGFAEVNVEIKNEAGAPAIRATTKGVDHAKEKEIKKMATEETAAKVEFVIEDGIAMPVTKRGGGVGNKVYPFDALNVGQSFMVPGKETKKMAGTVASANTRYAKVVEGQTRTNRKGNVVSVTEQEREFKVRAVEGGVRIFRTK